MNGRGRGGSTPLMYAALYSDAATVKALLQAGANPNLRNEAGATPLMWAIDSAEKTKLLLDAGAEVDARSNDGRTALTIATARVGASDGVKVLLERGAKFNAPQPSMNDSFLGDAESLNHVLSQQGKATGLAAAVRMRCLKCLDVMLTICETGRLDRASQHCREHGRRSSLSTVGGSGSPASESRRRWLYHSDACERGRTGLARNRTGPPRSRSGCQCSD